MKKIIWSIFIFSLWIPFVFAEENSSEQKTTTTTQEQENSSQSNLEKDQQRSSTDSGLNLATNAKSAIMLEASTGKIMYEKNKDEQLPMASMTKMMTLLLIMEEIEKGNLKWDEMVTASEHAASMGGSQIFLEVGEQMSVEDMVKGICIGSGNELVVSIKQSQHIKEEIII